MTVRCAAALTVGATWRVGAAAARTFLLLMMFRFVLNWNQFPNRSEWRVMFRPCAVPCTVGGGCLRVWAQIDMLFVLIPLTVYCL